MVIRMDNRSIGVFDSGLGGLTTVKELQQLLPHENIVYFGDTARVPYGTRSREIITRYARQDIRFLLTHDVKLIIIACGTVSSILTEELISEQPVPIIRVLGPAAQAACAANRKGDIAVIGTTATVRSGAYGKAIRAVNPTARVIGKACPLFVPLVENGYIGRDNLVTQLVAKEYLNALKNEDIDTVILGCTHYPLLYDVIGDVLGGDITLIDAGKETARYAAATLKSMGLVSESTGTGSAVFYVGDQPDDFAEIAARFLGADIRENVNVVDIEKF